MKRRKQSKCEDSSSSKSEEKFKIIIIVVNVSNNENNTVKQPDVKYNFTKTEEKSTTLKPINITNNKTKRSLRDYLTEDVSEIERTKNTNPSISPLNLKNIFTKFIRGMNSNNNHTNNTDNETKNKKTNHDENTTKIVPSLDGDFVGPFGYNPTPMPLIPIQVNPEYYNYYNFSYTPQIPEAFNYSTLASPYGSLPPISISPFPIMKTLPQMFNMTMWANIPNVVRTIYNMTRMNGDINNANLGSALYTDIVEGSIRFE